MRAYASGLKVDVVMGLRDKRAWKARAGGTTDTSLSVEVNSHWGRRLNPSHCHAHTVAALDALSAELTTMWKDQNTFYQRFEMKAEAILKKASLEEEDYVYARLRDMLQSAHIPPRPDFR